MKCQNSAKYRSRTKPYDYVSRNWFFFGPWNYFDASYQVIQNHLTGKPNATNWTAYIIQPINRNEKYRFQKS